MTNTGLKLVNQIVQMLRQAAEKNSEFQKAALDSIAPVKILLTDIIMRLELKGKNFQVFSAASAAEIDSLWNSLLAIDHEMRLRHDDKITAKNLSPALADFMAHCCKQRHYFFDILENLSACCVSPCGFQPQNFQS